MQNPRLNRATLQVANTKGICGRVTAKSVKQSGLWRIGALTVFGLAISLIPVPARAQGGPDVTVVNTPNVNVVNTATNPVPVTGIVQTAENPARQAAQAGTAVVLTGGATSGQVTVGPIPAGKIFVLETVSFTASVSGGVASIILQVTENSITGGGPVSVDYPLVIPPPTSGGFLGGSQPLRLYALPQTNILVFFAASASSTNQQSVTVGLSGYFVNAQ